MKTKEYCVCSRCVMDNASDDTIKFDKRGYCNYCSEVIGQINTTAYFPNDEGKAKLEKLLNEIRENGKGKKYDAIMGISGGLDSSYLTYLGYVWGLRILLLHVDDGFDTEISKKNIQRLVEKTGFDFVSIAPDSEQYCDLTKAFMKASVPNLAIPQDNILFAQIYSYMKENKIKYFLSGGNFALESILQRGNTHDAFDKVNIKDIHKKFGTLPIDKLELLSTVQRVIDRFVINIKSPKPLDYVEYNRDRALMELNEFCGFEYYGSKHLENTLTAFIQLYWFPKKFGVDKRRSHLSSMIISGQMTREDALKILSEPMIEEAKMEDIISDVKRKLNLSDTEFDSIMASEPRQHDYYKTFDRTPLGMLFNLRRVIRRKLHR